MIRSIHVNHIEVRITYKIPIKIIVLGFVGESQPTCCSTDRITVANFGVPIQCSKPEFSTLRSRSKRVQINNFVS